MRTRRVKGLGVEIAGIPVTAVLVETLWEQFKPDRGSSQTRSISAVSAISHALCTNASIAVIVGVPAAALLFGSSITRR